MSAMNEYRVKFGYISLPDGINKRRNVYVGQTVTLSALIAESYGDALELVSEAKKLTPKRQKGASPDGSETEQEQEPENE